MQNNATYENYTKIRVAAGIVSDYAVSKATGILPSQFSRWKSKGWTPKYRDLRKLANFLNCTVDQIYGYTDETETD